MIRYALTCADGHGFEAWFRSSDAFDWQVAAKEVHCPVCGDIRIGKVPMAPHVARRKEPITRKEKRRSYAMLRDLREKLTANSEDVGSRFPEEARKIHYEEVAPRGIHGEASLEEARALDEEGVSFWPLPRLPEDEH